MGPRTSRSDCSGSRTGSRFCLKFSLEFSAALIMREKSRRTDAERDMAFSLQGPEPADSLSFRLDLNVCTTAGCCLYRSASLAVALHSRARQASNFAARSIHVRFDQPTGAWQGCYANRLCNSASDSTMIESATKNSRCSSLEPQRWKLKRATDGKLSAIQRPFRLFGVWSRWFLHRPNLLQCQG